MNLLERFKAWATSWWYVPTIEARQAQMLREIRNRGGWFRFTCGPRYLRKPHGGKS